MDSQTILMCVVALVLGMLLANMLKSVCGCKVVEGQSVQSSFSVDSQDNIIYNYVITILFYLLKMD